MLVASFYGQCWCVLTVVLFFCTITVYEIPTNITDDETIVLFDARYLDENRPPHRTKHMGGGIWRMKWHPYSPDRMLVAAMHGGCRVLNFGGGVFATGSGNDHGDHDKKIMETAGNHIPNTASFDEALLEGRVASKCSKSFTEHESMAYGADWLVCPHPTQNGYFEAAAR